MPTLRIRDSPAIPCGAWIDIEQLTRILESRVTNRGALGTVFTNMITELCPDSDSEIFWPLAYKFCEGRIPQR